MRTALEQCLASLEEARFGLAFSSGMAAADAVLSLLRPGDHVVASKHLYGGTIRIFEKVYAPRGVAFTYVDGACPAAFADAVRDNTRMLWIETPANPLLQLVDVRGCGSRESQRNPPRGRQHVCLALFPTAACARGGHRDAQHHQVHQRAQRRRRGCCRYQRSGTFRDHQVLSERGRSRARAARLLAEPAQG